MVNLEAVTVCYRYGDFLRETAQYNRGLFDRWIIVTGSDDLETRHVCRELGMQCVMADDALRDKKFAKGRMIDHGLHMLSAGAWRLHLDADIVLPSFAHKQLLKMDLDSSCIYGADRIYVQSWEDWQKLQASGWMDGKSSPGNYVHFPDGYKVGTRWASPTQGYVPIGFFQLWHADADEWSGSRIRPYPSAHGNACRTDVQHALQWERRKRVLLPELIVAHLDSEPEKTGANWNGRTTKRFAAPAKHGGMPTASLARKPEPKPVHEPPKPDPHHHEPPKPPPHHGPPRKPPKPPPHHGPSNW
jgi:hypothetical protein